MLPEEVRTATQARAIVEERGLAHVKVGVFDNDGILRGKKHYRGLENADMRMPIERLHTETKVLAQRRGLMATFMAKWSQQLPGQSGHLHVSLARKDGASAFHDPAAPHSMSQEMRWFVGGQQAQAAERLAHSKAAQELFGAPFVSHFAASREWEEREFRRAVPDWELARYFEII